MREKIPPLKAKIPERISPEIGAEELGILLEHWLIENLPKRYGIEVIRASREDDYYGRIDFWVVDKKRRVCIPVQVSLKPELMRGKKGLEVIRRGIVPWFISYNLARRAVIWKEECPSIGTSLLYQIEKCRQVLGSKLKEVSMSQLINQGGKR